MKLENYYKLISPKEGKRVLISGGNAVEIALFITGKAREEGKNIEATALLPPEKEIEGIGREIEEVKEKYPELRNVFEKGAVKTTFERKVLKDFYSKLKYNYLVFEEKSLSKKDFEKIIELKLEKVLFLIPLSYSMPLEYTYKKLFFEKKELKSLRQMLELNGAKILIYEPDGKNLVVLFTGLKKEFELKEASAEKAADKIIKEIGKYLKYIRGGSEFALTSKDEEYLYYVKVKDERNGPFDYEFIFLNGTYSKKTGELKARSKEYEIVVLPNTKLFRKELEQKEVIITTKERAVQIFQETYSPY